MKSKIIALAMLFVSVAMAGVVTVSDPGQAQGKTITTMDIVPFVNVSLTASNLSDQTVYLTIKQSGAGSDIDLFTGSGCSNKLTGMQTVLGPFVVKSGQTNNIVVSARVNSVKATNSSPTVSLDLMTVSNSTPGVVQGTLPIVGTSYIVDTNSQEVVKGKITGIYVFPNYEGAPPDTNGVSLDLLYMSVAGDPLRLYQVQYSEDMVSWHPIAELFDGLNDWMFTGGDNTFATAYFMRLPPNCYYRLMSKPQ